MKVLQSRDQESFIKVLSKHAGGDVREMVATKQRNPGYGHGCCLMSVFALELMEARHLPGQHVPKGFYLFVLEH